MNEGQRVLEVHYPASFFCISVLLSSDEVQGVREACSLVRPVAGKYILC